MHDRAMRFSQRVRLLDGALGTELEARGHDLSDSLWSARLLVDNPGAIQEVHAAYLQAGADCIITASYQASVEGLMKLGFSEAKALDFIASSVDIARSAKGSSRALVAASIGPYGAALADGSEFSGNYALDEEDLLKWHQPRFSRLAASEADLLALETIPSFAEARALARALRSSSRFGWMSFSCRDGAHLNDGTPIVECCRYLAGHPKLLAVGVNCTPPEHIESLVKLLRENTELPVIAYPNAGGRFDGTTRSWVPACAPRDFVERSIQWRRAGASVVGGCCQIGPAQIRALAASLGKGGL